MGLPGLVAMAVQEVQPLARHEAAATAKDAARPVSEDRPAIQAAIAIAIAGLEVVQLAGFSPREFFWVIASPHRQRLARA